jgi:hypothetical protein
MISANSYPSEEPSVVYATLMEVNPEAKVAVGFERAYLGCTVGTRPVAVYEYETCIEIIRSKGDISEEDAVLYFYYHTVSQCTCEDSPHFVRVT